MPGQLRSLAIERAKTYMLQHIEPDGTLYSYFSSTFLMIFALLSLGYSKKDPLITKAITGLISMKTEINGLPHMQYTTAHVWNTSLINTALQFAGVSPENPAVKRANHYLLERQHDQFGDWSIHNRNSLPGGWGESCLSDSQKRYIPLNSSTLVDTSWALDALIAEEEKPTKEIERGMMYLLTSLDKNDWTTDYPKGQGMAGNFYLHYHSYRYIFPLLTLSHYHKKFKTEAL